MKSLLAEYSRKKSKIRKRLKEFGKISKKDIFAELAFCILTPQSNAVRCDRAIKELKRCGLFHAGSEEEIRPKLKGLARFHNKKATYLVGARKIFRTDNRFNAENRPSRNDILKTRDWLVDNIKGLGYKEASHFLRNVGLGRDVAILDVHILGNLKKLGVIKKIPESLTKIEYLKVEGAMREFAKKINIPLEDLDLLLWSHETGFLFK